MNPVVLVTGSRKWADSKSVWDALDFATPYLVIEGGATGADRMAREWCDTHGVTNVTVPALWTNHGKSAGPRRNRTMLEIAITLAKGASKPLWCLAWPLPDSRGTMDMIQLCTASPHVSHVLTKEFA